VRHGHEGKASRPRDLAGLQLMRGIEIGVQKRDGRRVEAICHGGAQPGFQPGAVQRPQSRAGGIQPFVGLDHARVQRLRLGDVEGEQLGPGLVADSQGVAETARGHEQGLGALAFQERVGGDGGAHLDRRHPVRRKRRARRHVQHAAHGLNSGVLIGVAG